MNPIRRPLHSFYCFFENNIISHAYFPGLLFSPFFVFGFFITIHDFHFRFLFWFCCHVTEELSSIFTFHKTSILDWLNSFSIFFFSASSSVITTNSSSIFLNSFLGWFW